MAFAENLKHLMDVEGYSKYKLAKELGCHQTTVQNWLSGSIPQKRTQKNIAAVFGISSEDLMGDAVPTPKIEKNSPPEDELAKLQQDTIDKIMRLNFEQLQAISTLTDSILS